MFKFDFTYGEISTINDALVDFLINLKKECERLGKPELYKESVAFNLYCKIGDAIDEYEK